MTVIAWDGNMLAADKQTTFGHERGLFPTRKILEKNGRLYGFSGMAGMLEPLAEWFDKGRVRSDIPACDGEWSMLVIETDGRALLLSGKTPYPTEVSAPFAIGDGGDFALGAMHANATARDAVVITSRLCVSCGNGIDVLFPALREPQTEPDAAAIRS
jgi:ATP-dependent protease HslVU (ClpYQ) peptidase subunit